MTDFKPNSDLSKSVHAGYEITDTNPYALLGGSVVILVVIGVIILFLNEVFLKTADTLQHDQFLSKPTEIQKINETLQAQGKDALTTYKAVQADSVTKRIQIPIERAMELIANETQATRAGKTDATPDTTTKKP